MKRPSDLAKVLGVGQNYVSNWESGENAISLPYGFLICDKLGITLDWLYRENPAGLSQDRYEAIMNYREPNSNTQAPRPFRKRAAK